MNIIADCSFIIMLRTNMILFILYLSLVTATKKIRDYYPDIKASAEGWEVADPGDLPYADLTLQELSKMFSNDIGLMPGTTPLIKQEQKPRDSSLPSSFDARIKWPGCIQPLRNQLTCGSCYAYGTTGVLSDRFCIHSNGRVNITLSVQDMVSCAGYICNGCNGCVYPYSWIYLETSGVVTEECFPYKNEVTECIPDTKRCIDGRVKYEKYYAKPWSTRYPYMNIDKIKKEIITNGPVAAVIIYTLDYLYYRGGIFTSDNRIMLGTHMVKLIGWGVGHVKGEPVEYWIIQDSQGIGFGDRGYSYIKMGIIGVDSHVSWSMPLLKS